MIVAAFIGILFLAFLYYVWIDLGELIATEIGAGGSAEGVRGVRSGGPTATATAGADSPYDWDTAA